MRGKPLPPEVWEGIAASLVIAWRAGSVPLPGLWRDWVLLLAAFWLFTAIAGRTRAWPVVLGVGMSALLALYAAHQVPLTFAHLGSLR